MAVVMSRKRNRLSIKSLEDIKIWRPINLREQLEELRKDRYRDKKITLMRTMLIEIEVTFKVEFIQKQKENCHKHVSLEDWEGSSPILHQILPISLLFFR